MEFPVGIGLHRDSRPKHCKGWLRRCRGRRLVPSSLVRSRALISAEQLLSMIAHELDEVERSEKSRPRHEPRGRRAGRRRSIRSVSCSLRVACLRCAAPSSSEGWVGPGCRASPRSTVGNASTCSTSRQSLLDSIEDNHRDWAGGPGLVLGEVGMIAACASNNLWRSLPAVTMARAAKRIRSTSTTTSGWATRLWYQSGLVG